MKTNRERRKQAMYDLIARWRLSGQTQKAFCQQEQVSLHTFKYYVTRKKTERQQTSASPKFVPVTVSSDKRPHLLKIIYPNGVSVDVANATDAHLLRTLIHLY